MLLPAGTNPQPYVAWPDFQRNSIMVRTVGVSQYDSLQTKFQRRWHNGLAFLLAYTLSEAKTNAGDSLSGGQVGNLRGPDLVGYDLENDVRLAAFHTRHSLVFSGNYDLPGKGILLGGWRANWVLMLYSGQPQTVNCAVATGAGTNCYALVVGDPRRPWHGRELLQRGGVRHADAGGDDRPDGLLAAGRRGHPGDRTGDETARLRPREVVQRVGSAAGRVPRRNVQPDQHAGVQPATARWTTGTHGTSRASPTCGTRRGRCSSG